MHRYNWKKLNHLQIGKYAEYYSKMEFTMYGFDVYTAEVDDKGIDFIIRLNEDYFDIQVKSLRSSNYIFFQKDKFNLRKNLFSVIVLFEDSHEPKIYLIPSLEWQNSNNLLVGRDYDGKKSKPEWGLNITKKSNSLLEQYRFDIMIEKILLNLQQVDAQNQIRVRAAEPDPEWDYEAWGENPLGTK